MMYKLNIFLDPISDEINQGFGKPSLIRLVVLNDNLVIVKEIVRVKWDADVVLEWFATNKEALFYEEFPGEINDNGAIFSAINDFYENVDPDDVDKLDNMFAYRKSHGLRFALRGVDVPDVYIGKRRDGSHEICCGDDNESWVFKIDLRNFWENLEEFVQATPKIAQKNANFSD